jgi:hypothetical protein
MVATGFDVIIKLVSGGTCTCSNDVTSLAGGTCTKIPYLDSYSNNWSMAMIDYTGFGDKVTKQLPGIPSGTLDFSGGLDLSDASQLDFWNGISCTTKRQRMFKIHDGGKKITVKGYLSGTQIGSTPTGKSTFGGSISATQLPKTC